MNKGLSRRTSLDLAQSYKIAPLEVAIAVFKLPQRCLGVSGVKNVADYMQLSTTWLALEATER